MAMNPPTYSALRRMANLINKLETQTDQGVVDEIKAWNRLLKKHIGQQKRQPNRFSGHSYKYDKEKQKIQRYNGKELVAEY
jgi:hypothetical protein